jgi:peptidoglycan/LPS O-acetylase OafA/YrhL
LFALSAERETISLGGYFRNRVLRLVIPTWIFFAIFFAMARLLPLGGSCPFSESYIWKTFIFSGDVRYVWIIRVFLLLAIAAPVLHKVRRTLAGDRAFFLFLAFVYIFYEWFLKFYAHHAPACSFMKRLVSDYVLYFFPYACVFGVGMCLKDMSRQKVFVFSALWLAIFLVLFFLLNGQVLRTGIGRLVMTQSLKYPPRLYYLSYALFASLFLYGLLGHMEPGNILRDKFFIFVNRYSLELYLWHIAFLQLFCLRFVKTSWAGNSAVKWMIIVSCSLGAVWLQARFWTYCRPRLGRGGAHAV